MNAQDVMNQSADQASKIVEGASLNLALKSQPGQVILDAILTRFADKLDHLVMDPLRDEDVLRVYYELRGMVELCEEMGESIRQATQLVARSSIQSKLRVKRDNQEE